MKQIDYKTDAQNKRITQTHENPMISFYDVPIWQP